MSGAHIFLSYCLAAAGAIDYSCLKASKTAYL